MACGYYGTRQIVPIHWHVSDCESTYFYNMFKQWKEYLVVKLLIPIALNQKVNFSMLTKLKIIESISILSIFYYRLLEVVHTSQNFQNYSKARQITSSNITLKSYGHISTNYIQLHLNHLLHYTSTMAHKCILHDPLTAYTLHSLSAL